ncbi:MAG: T9SS type A sorting domain-containing protein [Bacteroidota bacterium]
MKTRLPMLLLVLFVSLSGKINAQITIDGCITCDTDWLSIGAKLNSNAGFGAAHDVQEILYYPDVANDILFLSVKSQIDAGTANGLGIWIDFTEKAGVPAGTDLGFAGGPHYMDGDGGSNLNFQADFEVDYMLAINPGNTGPTGNMFVDIADLTNSNATEFMGFTSIGIPGATLNNGGVFTASSVSFAFNNSDPADNGFEIAIPYSELGISTAGDFRIFAFIVSSTGFFSDVTVPGDISTGNPGFGTNFNTAGTGPFNAGQTALSIEYQYFEARLEDQSVELNWSVETNATNGQFDILRSRDLDVWEPIGQSAQKTSQEYSYTDQRPIPGLNYYRIRWQAPDGSQYHSEIRSIKMNTNADVVLFPNPVADQLQVQTRLADPQIRIVDGLGRILVNQPLIQQQVDVSGLGAGFYLVEVLDASNNLIHRQKILIKE